MYIAMWLDIDSNGILDKAESKQKEIRDLIGDYIELNEKLSKVIDEDEDIKALNKYISNAPKIVKSKKILDSLESVQLETEKILNEKLKNYDEISNEIEQLRKTELFDILESIYFNLGSDRLGDIRHVSDFDVILKNAFDCIDMLIDRDQIYEDDLYGDEDRNYAMCALISLLTGVDIYLISVDGVSQFNAYKFMNGDINPDEYDLDFIDIIRSNL